MQKAEKAFRDANKAWNDDYNVYKLAFLDGNESYSTAHKNWKDARETRRKILKEGNLTDEQYDTTEQGIKENQLYKIWNEIEDKLRNDFDKSEQGRKLYEKNQVLWDIREKAEKALEQAKAKATAPALAAAPAPTENLETTASSDKPITEEQQAPTVIPAPEVTTAPAKETPTFQKKQYDNYLASLKYVDEKGGTDFDSHKLRNEKGEYVIDPKTGKPFEYKFFDEANAFLENETKKE